MASNAASIRVLIRVRPLNDKEKSGPTGRKSALTIGDGGGRSHIDFGGSSHAPNSEDGGATVTIHSDIVESSLSTVASTVPTGGKQFTFDAVHGQRSNQSEVFESVKSIVEAVEAGYNGTIVAYGQTGSGKTHTVFGTNDDDCGAGLVQRSLQALFRRIALSQAEAATASLDESSASLNDSGSSANHLDESFDVHGGTLQTTAHASFFEIFNEKIYDLLSEDSLETTLHVRENATRGVYVDGLQEVEVKGASEAEDILSRGMASRHVAATAMNRTSSRSHAVFVLTLKSVNTSMDGLSKVRTSKFTLVDLAGSERQKQTEAVGDRLKEASMINSSLLTLGNVINALVDKEVGRDRHVPFRDSKLTFLLRDSWGGNSKTCLVATISPSPMSVSETMSTLKFAQRAKLIKNKAEVNENTCGNVAALQNEVGRLRAQLRVFAEQGQIMSSPNQVHDSFEQAATSLVSSAIPSQSLCHRETEIILPIIQKKARQAQERVECLERQSHMKDGVVRSLKRKLQEELMVRKFKQRRIEYLSKKTGGNDSSADEVSALCGEIDILRRQLETPSTEAVELKVEYEKVCDELDEKLNESPGSASGADRESLEACVERLLGEKQELEDRVSELMRASEETQNEIDSILCEVGRQEREMEGQKRAIVAKEKALQTAEGRAAAAESDLKGARQATAEIEATVDRLRETSEGLEGGMKLLTAELEKKSIEMVEIGKMNLKTESELKSKLQELTKQLEYSKFKCDEKSTAELKAKEQLAAASKDNSILVQRVQKAADEIIRQKRTLNDMGERIREVQSEKERTVNKLQYDLQELEAKTDYLETEKEELTDRIRYAEEKISKEEAVATSRAEKYEITLKMFEEEIQSKLDKKDLVIEEIRAEKNKSVVAFEGRANMLDAEKSAISEELKRLEASALFDRQNMAAAHSTEISALKNTITKAEKQMHTIQEEKSKTVEEAQSRINELEVMLESKVRALEVEKQALAEKIMILEKEKENISTAADAAMAKERDCYATKLNNLEEATSILKKETSVAVEKEQKRMAGKLVSLEAQVELLGSQKTALMASVGEVKSNYKEKQNKNKELVEKMETSLEEMQIRIKALETERELIIEESQKTLELREASYNETVKYFEGEKVKLQQDVVELNNTLEEARESAVKAVAREKTHHNMALEKMESNVKELEGTIKCLQEEKERLSNEAQQKLSDYEEKLKAIEAEKDESSKKIQSLRDGKERADTAAAQKCVEYGIEMKGMKEKLGKLERDISLSETKAIAGGDLLKAALRSLEDEKQNLLKKVAWLEAAAEEALSAESAVKAEIVQQEALRTEIEKRLEKVQKESAGIVRQVHCDMNVMKSALEGKAASFERERDELSTIILSLQKGADEAKTADDITIAELRKAMKNVEKKVAVLEKEKKTNVGDMHTKINALEQEQKSLNEQAGLWERSAKESKKRAESLSDKVRLAERARSSLEFELDTLREDQDSLNEQVRKLHEQNGALERENFRLNHLVNDAGMHDTGALSPVAESPIRSGSGAHRSPQISPNPASPPKQISTPFRDLSSQMCNVLNKISTSQRQKASKVDDSFDESMFLPNIATNEKECYLVDSPTKKIIFMGDKENMTPSRRSTTKKKRPLSARKDLMTPSKIFKRMPLSESTSKENTNTTPLRPFSVLNGNSMPSGKKLLPTGQTGQVRTGWSNNLRM